VTTRAGRTSTSQLTIVAGAGPALDTSSSGGGGALGAGWLLLLGLAVLGLWRASPRRAG